MICVEILVITYRLPWGIKEAGEHKARLHLHTNVEVLLLIED